MDELELSKYMNWMEKEYGPEWKDVLRDQLRTNQFGDLSNSSSRGLGLLSNREDLEQVLRSRLVDNPEYPHIKPGLSPTEDMSIDGVPRGEQLLSEQPFGDQWEEWGQTSDPYVFQTQDSLKDYIAGNFPDTDPNLGFPSAFHAAEGEVPLEAPLETSSSLPFGSGGYASLDAAAGMPYVEPQVAQRLADSSSLLGPSSPPPLALSTSQAVAQAYPMDYTTSGANIYGQAAESAQAVSAAEAGATAAETGTSAWGGPMTFAGNMALNMIPTRDKEKVDTFAGDEGSKSGILKGTGKGALTGATIGSYWGPVGTAWGGAIGGGLGFLGGSMGYFDSTSPPAISISRIKRGGGMPQGLLGGGSMYG